MSKHLIKTLVICALAVMALNGTTLGSEASIDYKIRVSASDLSGFEVEMRFRSLRGAVRIAMAAHPEYDDRYWRYIENVSAADAAGRPLRVTREDDPVWGIENAAGVITVKYRLSLPRQERPIRDAWKPHLTPTGGMVGDLHSLMYLIGEEKARAMLTLEMPSGWKAASGLNPTSAPNVFTGSVELMLDSPVMIVTREDEGHLL